ncbi:hypothetical protein ADUPG1_012944 [Aduncisulcus paluster]|uniref:Uncharacterized protein n=1 Tax=Aduncisulcus paluster TaxID=2918883 RepID=A0ABQ5K179_9EUKA|nr:hypothetical protein ADUPG1_012944 [Aduncisulcus paluster]
MRSSTIGAPFSPYKLYSSSSYLPRKTLEKMVRKIDTLDKQTSIVLDAVRSRNRCILSHIGEGEEAIVNGDAFHPDDIPIDERVKLCREKGIEGEEYIHTAKFVGIKAVCLKETKNEGQSDESASTGFGASSVLIPDKESSIVSKNNGEELNLSDKKEEDKYGDEKEDPMTKPEEPEPKSEQLKEALEHSEALTKSQQLGSSSSSSVVADSPGSLPPNLDGSMHVSQLHQQSLQQRHEQREKMKQIRDDDQLKSSVCEFSSFNVPKYTCECGLQEPSAFSWHSRFESSKTIVTQSLKLLINAITEEPSASHVALPLHLYGE